MRKPVPFQRIVSALALPGLSLLACRPVMTIGLPEILILLVLLAFLFGPLLFRIFSWYQKYKGDQREKHDRKK